MKYEIVEWKDDNNKKFKSIILDLEKKDFKKTTLMTVQNDLTAEDLADMSLDLKLFEDLITRLKSIGKLK